MKIGIFTEGYPPQINGVATSVENSVKGLRKRGNEVFVVAAKYPNVKDEKYVTRLSSIPVIRDMNLRMATHLPERALFRLSKIEFDIIHCHSGGPLTIMGLEFSRLKRTPAVFTYHTLFNQYTHYVFRGKLITPKMAETASRILCNRFDYIIAPTLRIRKELVSYGVKKPIAVIASGIDTKKFDVKDDGFLRSKTGIPNDQKILLYVGRLAKEKSLDFVIRSFRIVAEKDKSCVLVITGNGTKKDVAFFKNLSRSLKLEKRVYFTGAFKPSEIEKVYAGGYVFLFASASETQGMVVWEALASGLPVIAVRDKALEDAIESGKNGIFTKRDENEFAKTVLEFLKNNDLRERMSKNAKESAQKFSLEKNAEELEKVYKKVLSEQANKRIHEVVLSSEINIPVERIWELLTDLTLYTKYVKHTQKVYGPKKLTIGTGWQDWSTMLWVPIKVSHKVVVFDKNKAIGFDIPFPWPVGGEMIQRIYLERNGPKTKFNASMKFRFGNRFVNILISSILKARLRDTMLYTMEKTQKDRLKLMGKN